MSRKIAREYAYKLIFEYIFTKETDDGISKDIIFLDQELSKIDSEYIESVVHGVKEHYDELLEIISRNAKNFKLERIFRADLAALLLAVYEMKYMPDIPMNVSIAEAVEIVKSYATEKSYQFVNGVLSGVYKELNA
jgi:transcription antitermination protein NusB